MDNPSSDQSALSPYRAFVVQLTENMDAEHGQWTGRVEHVTSGQATRFQSLEQLLVFVAQDLAARAKPAPDK